MDRRAGVLCSGTSEGDGPRSAEQTSGLQLPAGVQARWTSTRRTRNVSRVQTFAEQIRERLESALGQAGLPVQAGQTAVSEATDARFGDYQSNVAMTLAKAARKNPREIATTIAGCFDGGTLCAAPEVAGAGFLNFRLTDDALARHATALLADLKRLGVEPASLAHTIVIDFSSPNIAKAMHVGHIRSTILGDALARIARFLGHRVITDNHVGDWGTQFGKVIHGWKTILNTQTLESDPIGELVRLYREINALAGADPGVEAQCRAELVKLQQGDPENRAIWERCVELSMRDFNSLYALLGIAFDHTLGESFYNPALQDVATRLEMQGLAKRSEGALVVWMPDLAETPFIVRKADGGFNYATTDIATLEYRVREWRADAVWYVVGAPQQLHFKMLFALAQDMGIEAELVHIAFGSILGEDRKLMKTRSGENVSLRSVLEESIERATAQVRERHPDFDAPTLEHLGRIIGIGAVKYAELSQHRMSDYVFSWERMLSLQGNTAPYLQNACVRARAIFRKADEDPAAQVGPILAGEPAERALARKCAAFAEIAPAVLDGWRPNLLANYLFELANAFHTFYEACPVLKADGSARASRLALTALALATLERGLALLGIEAPERM